MLDETRVREIRPTSDGVDVITDAGTFHAARMVVTSDAWTNQVLAGAGVQIPLTVTQEQVTYWATPNLRAVRPGSRATKPPYPTPKTAASTSRLG